MKQLDRILLIKMDHIGDALWSFPAIHALRLAFPSAAIDILCTPYLAEAFRRLEDLDQVIEYDSGASLTEKQAILRKLRNPTYSVAIVLGPVDKVNHLAFLSRAQERIGYAYAGNWVRAVTGRLFLTGRFPHPADVAGKAGLPLPHEVKALLALVKKTGAAAPDDPELFFPLTSEEKASAAAYLQQLLPGKTAFAALHLCAKSFRHGWTEEAFCGLAAKLQTTLPDTGWIVTAGPAEEPYLDSYREALAGAGIPVVSGLNLGGMAALLAEMRLLVSWDTGVVHLATAVGTPVVDIFPDKDFEYCVQRWGPWGAGGHSVRQRQDVLDASTLDTLLRTVLKIAMPRQEVWMS
jgi:ADP-heptose:LPS heptosyltransferase